MPYEKHTWETGETITVEKLNNIEIGALTNSGLDLTFSTSNEDDYPFCRAG